jgi:manganese transport protein
VTTTAVTRPVDAAAALTRRRVRGPLPLLGPAFVAAIAYVDPGNFATNITAGTRYGYLLVWVVVASNLIAMLVQYLTARLGILTGRNLAQVCRDELPRPVVVVLWVQAELVAIATDLAEIVGGAIALQLLFGLPLVAGGLVTGTVAFAVLAIQRSGPRPFESVITALLLIIATGFVVALGSGGWSTGGLVHGTVPHFDGTGSVVLATGILGATVMPHAIYFHAALTQDRYTAGSPSQIDWVLRAQRTDVVSAMSLAGLLNVALLAVAAGVPGLVGDPIHGLYRALGAEHGAPVAALFAIALLASGLAASSVGTFAGQVVMDGFLRRSVPIVVRRVATMAPAIVVLAVGANPTTALVASQVVLSFGLPFALVPLVWFSARRDLLGSWALSCRLTVVAVAATAVVIALNLALIVLSA